MTVEEHDDKVILSLDNDSSTSVTILKYGATVISWKNKGVEQLWLSDAAKLDGSKPVRGGIPLVFPNFGKTKDESHATGKLPQHGFARNSVWEFLGQTSASPLTIQFALGPEQANPELLKIWGDGDYDFTLFLSISLADKLETKIEVENRGSKPFDFHWLFHTYFRVEDIEDIIVNNLTEEKCYDQLLKTWYTEKAPMVNFNEEFDRIYKGIPERKILQIVDKGNVVKNIKRDGLPDAVVWNPWTEKAKGMGDFEPKDGFFKMLCVEAGSVTEWISLEPGKVWSASQELTLGGEILVQSNIFA